MVTRNEGDGSIGGALRPTKCVKVSHMTQEPNEEERLPRDFELPIEPHDPEDTDQTAPDKEKEMFFVDGETTISGHLEGMIQDPGISFLLTGSGDPPPKGISLSQEGSLVISSTISLYSSYVEYIRETEPELHKRALAYSSDTVDLHPSVVLTDQEGTPLERFRDPEDGDNEDDGYDDEEDRR